MADAKAGKESSAKAEKGTSAPKMAKAEKGTSAPKEGASEKGASEKGTSEKGTSAPKMSVEKGTSAEGGMKTKAGKGDDDEMDAPFGGKSEKMSMPHSEKATHLPADKMAKAEKEEEATVDAKAAKMSECSITIGYYCYLELVQLSDSFAIPLFITKQAI